MDEALPMKGVAAEGCGGASIARILGRCKICCGLTQSVERYHGLTGTAVPCNHDRLPAK